MVPGLTETLRRDLPALEAGEWWRIITSLFMQADPAVRGQYSFLNAK